MQETGNNPINKNLSIRFAADGFSFCADGNRRNITFDSKSGFHHSMAVCLCEPDMWENFNTVNIEIDDLTYSLIPSSVFRESDCTTIMKFNYPNVNFKKYVIRPDYINGFDITNIYAIDNELNEFIQTHFPYATVSHLSTSLISKALKHSKKSEENEVWCYITNTHIFVALANNGNLLLANNFTVNGESDVLYYIGAIFTQYDLSQTRTPLYISGECSFIKNLKKHISNVIVTE